MPSITGPDQHGVDVLAGEEFAKIAVQHAIRVAVVLIDEFLSGLTPRRLYVADRDALHIRFGKDSAEVVGRAGPNSDHTQDDSLGSRNGLIHPQRLGGNDPGKSDCPRSHGTLHEITP